MVFGQSRSEDLSAKRSKAVASSTKGKAMRPIPQPRAWTKTHAATAAEWMGHWTTTN